MCNSKLLLLINVYLESNRWVTYVKNFSHVEANLQDLAFYLLKFEQFVHMQWLVVQETNGNIDV